MAYGVPTDIDAIINNSQISPSTINIVGNGSQCVNADSGAFGVDCNQGFVGIGDTSPDGQLEILSHVGPTQFLVAVSSQNDVLGNIFSILGSGAIATGATSPITISSQAFVGISVSSQVAGTAGTAVTATCSVARTFATGGGCNCGTIVAGTSVINTPNCVTAGCQPTGWTCQVSGGTGGQCSAYVICSRLQ